MISLPQVLKYIDKNKLNLNVSETHQNIDNVRVYVWFGEVVGP